ncbi:MAG TPA: hypothetical protein PKA82_06835 [Pyrinomonadaceae bacterium]|nr:hypothetical protein [Pyrinomonadaceae bacterium]
MKTAILTFALIFTFSMFGYAQTPEFVTVKHTKQVVAKKSKLKIKLLEVVEDSRCPAGVQCIWAGNAKIKVLVTSGTRSQEFVINTTDGPTGNSFAGWAIYLEELSSKPETGPTIDPQLYKAKFKIVKLTR